MDDAWIADRMRHIDASGIRKAFDMAKAMKDPINLSIGLPDFDVRRPGQGRRDRGDRARAQRRTPSPRGSPSSAASSRPRSTPSSATPTARCSSPRAPSGALLLALCAVVNPGDEVIIFDPYFVMYSTWSPWPAGRRSWSTPTPTSGSTPRRSPRRSRPRTKCVLVNSPGQPDRRRRLGRRDAGAGRALPASGTSC